MKRTACCVDGTAVALTHNGRLIAILDDIEIYAHRKEERCARIFGTVDNGHPSIDTIMQQGDYLVGGDLKVLIRSFNDDPDVASDGLNEYRLTPAQLRQRILVSGEVEAIDNRCLCAGYERRCCVRVSIAQSHS